MSNNHPAVDTLLTWKGFGYPKGREHGAWDSVCRLRLYEREAAPVVIVVSDLERDEIKYPDGTGTSITNSAKNLVRMVTQQYGIGPGEFVWLEQYPKTSTGEAIARVEFEHTPNATDGMTYQKPHWSHVSHTEAVALTGDANF